jgi:CDP-6-deoxy-D-xylo-4-hexulose-3-dehydrase
MKNPKQISVSYAAAVYGKAEIQAVVGVLKNPSKIVAGPAVKAFEKSIAALFGKGHGVMVNSGSSANLMALEAFDFPKGSEIITPALTFSTTVAPLVQKGLVPVFADVRPGTYVIDVDQIEPLITKKTAAIMVPSLIGNIPDLVRIQSIAKKHSLRVIEDSCDTLGARFAGKPTGAYTDASTTSFYASHIITAAGGGGMVCFHDAELAKRALVVSNWGRQSTLFGSYEQSEEIKKRFAGRLDGEPYDAKFLFSEIGYNLQPSELEGAFGLVQLKRLAEFTRRRKKHFVELTSFFKTYDRWFILPEADPRTDNAWLAFPLTIRTGAPFTRMEITKYLEEHHIQTRPIFTGNILRQPAFRDLAAKRRRGGYPVTDHIMKNGFLIGCHHGLTAAHMKYLTSTLAEFLSQYAD